MSALPLEILRTPEQAHAVMDPVRLRLLRELGEPASASGLSKRVGMKRQLINYHLRELEKVGLISLVEERRKGNCTERIVQASARAYLVDPAAMGEVAADPARIRDRFSTSYLIAVAAKAISDVATLRRRADAASKGAGGAGGTGGTPNRVPSITLQSHVRFASADDRNAFAEDLANEIAKLIAEYHSDGADSEAGRWYTFFLGGYPTITKDEAGRTLPTQPSSGVDAPGVSGPATEGDAP